MSNNNYEVLYIIEEKETENTYYRTIGHVSGF
jgi:hypothetical protein